MIEIKADFTELEVQKYLEEEASASIKALTYELETIGEAVVMEARTRDHGWGNAQAPSPKSYKSQTGNLRSSIGYLITFDGQEVATAGFNPIDGGVDGAKEGKDYAKSIAKDYTGKGIQLVVVAGMNYARHVHDMGYDVLDSGQLIAEKMMGELEARINN